MQFPEKKTKNRPQTRKNYFRRANFSSHKRSQVYKIFEQHPDHNTLQKKVVKKSYYPNQTIPQSLRKILPSLNEEVEQRVGVG